MATVAAGAAPAYPVHVAARPVPDNPSRGLWLVKWILVIPHALVLALLWAAFVVLSVVALVAIVVTGRYPRAIFDFNVGVLRWSWRVAYYSYGALATDRYPPFSLGEVPDYPAHLDVEYPERLSRGLVLVKWWLLVLPHYLLLVFFLGAGAAVARQVEGLTWMWEGGLIALLVLIAGVALLFTGGYPRGLYDLLLGLNRWVLRVAAYAGLMTDSYPPFRLDQGGPDPEVQLTAPTSGRGPVGSQVPGADATAVPGAVAPSSWTAGRAVAVVAGSLAVLLGLAAALAGAALLVWQSALREDGYLTTPTWQVETAGYAAVTEEIVLAGEWLDDGLGDVRLRATGDDAAIFLGVATAKDAAAYLGGVAREQRDNAFVDRELPGGAPAVPPAEADIWLASAEGGGQLVLDLEPRPGSFVVVVMSADGGAGVRASVDAGATLPWVGAGAGVALAAGLVLLAGGLAVVVLSVRAASPARVGRREEAQP